MSIVLRTNSNLKNFLVLLIVRRARLIRLRDEHMVFSIHTRIKTLDEDIRNIQSIINGKCIL